MTLLEKPKVVRPPEAPIRRRFGWILWVVLAFLIVAGIIAAIMLTIDGVPANEVGAALALDNQVAANRIAALDQAAATDLALEFTSIRVMEDMFPGRMEMLQTSVERSDQALNYTIGRVLGG